MKAARLEALVAMAIVATAILLPPTDARAWTPISDSRPVWSGPVPYAIHNAGSADLGGFAATEAIVRAGMEDWTRLECTSLTVTYSGPTSAQPFGSARAVIGWLEGSWPAESSAIGVTRSAFDGGGNLLDANMALNGVHFTWTTDPGSGSRVNAYSIILHEGGHYYGLGHSESGSAAMFYAYSGGVSMITSDDRTGICTLYPGMGGGVTDCTTSGCPAGQVCEGGTCVEMRGTADICDPCTADSQCAGTGSRCLMYPDTTTRCGRYCTSDADCDGARCQPVSDGSMQCVMRDGAGAATCDVAPMDPTPTDPTDPTSPDAGTTPPDGTTDPSAGTRGLNAPCDNNEQCVSGMCAVSGDRSFCTQMCDPATSPCPSGFQCVAVGDVSVCQPSDPTMVGTGGTGGGAGATPGADDGTLYGHACSASAPGAGGAPIASLVLAAFVALIRRRRR